MLLISLFWQFMKIGFFAIGGGLATIPFLMSLSKTSSWFSLQDLTNMIALSESTPGPLGVNMATFVGIKTAGLLGGIIATLGLVFPSIIVIVLISKVFNKVQSNKFVQGLFYGLRPAIAIMILFFVFQIIKLIVNTIPNMSNFVLSGVLLVLFTILTFRYKWHPIIFICIGAIMGILCQL